MYTLNMPPDNNGYKALPGNGVVANQLDGGGPRVRADQLGIVSTVNVQWTLDPLGFDTINAFFRTGSARASQPFQITLVGIDSSTPALYTVWFVPGTFGLLSNVGLTYVVGAQLWVAPNPTNPDNDLQLMGAAS
jgi:hypothetical protein